MIAFNLKIFLKKLCLVFCILIIGFAVLWLKRHNKAIPLSRPTAESESLKKLSKLKLFIPKNDYDFLFSNIPLSQRTFTRAKAIADDLALMLNVSVRLRGNHAWHWSKEKPSFRLKLNGTHTLYGRKELDYIVPEDPSGLSNILASEMASEVKAPHLPAVFAEVLINNAYAGLYWLSDTAIGSNISYYDSDRGTLINGSSWRLSAWHNSNEWEYASKLPNEQAEAADKMAHMLSFLKRPINPKLSEEFLTSCMDFNKTAAWSAFMTLIGSLHTDDFHNNFLIFNKAKSLLFPVIIDPAGFGVLTTLTLKNTAKSYEIPIYEYLTPILDLSFRNPLFQHKRNFALYTFINKHTPLHVSFLINAYKALIERIYKKETNAGAVITVPHLGFPIRLPVSYETRIKDADRLLEWYKNRINFLTSCLNQCKIDIYPVNQADNSEIENFVFEITGHSAAKINLGSIQQFVYADKNMNKTIEPTEGIAQSEITLYPALVCAYRPRKRSTEIDFLQIYKRLANYVLEPCPQSYMLGFSRAESKTCLSRIKSLAVNAITQGGVQVFFHQNEYYDLGKLYAHTDSLHCWSMLNETF